jgi:hypothetical protein
MPIPLEQPSTVIIDKARIEQFTIDPQYKRVTIQYSKGYEDTEGNYFPKENCKVDLQDVTFDSALYIQVKNALYALLAAAVNPQITD